MSQPINSQHIPAAIKALEPFVLHYGYLAVGGLLFLEDFGVLVPGETVLVTASLFAGSGKLNILIIILVGIVASIVGDSLGYTIGRFGGHPLLTRVGKYVFLSEDKIQKVENFFKKYGTKIVLVARFFDGLRELNGIMAGISEMNWKLFIIFNSLGATIWVVFWSLIGYYGSSHINGFLQFELVLTLVSLSIVIIRYLYKKHSKNFTKTSS